MSDTVLHRALKFELAVFVELSHPHNFPIQDVFRFISSASWGASSNDAWSTPQLEKRSEEVMSIVVVRAAFGANLVNRLRPEVAVIMGGLLV